MKDKCIIVGSGVAALAAAEIICEHKNVILFTKSTIEDSNSYFAQGGIAAAVHEQDSWQDHLEDTLAAGCAHADKVAAETLVKHGPAEMLRLLKEGMAFDRNAAGTLDLAREGAHSSRRILHSGGDTTGKMLIDFMISRLKESSSIQWIQKEMVIDLLVANDRCCGILARTEDGENRKYDAEQVLLATGGAGALFSCTSNRPHLTGDGMAMAFRAGAELIDMEFIQFHPTIAHINGKSLGLISEAVRGEGALLVDDSGRRIMEHVHPLKDLAPRDIVARQIHRELQKGKEIFLDIRPVPQFKSRFPGISSMLEPYSQNTPDGLIPVMPGSHFMMGGIQADTCGRTSLAGLFAVGETACTGVHGANRIASNSLLEGLVFGRMTGRYILEHPSVQADGFNHFQKEDGLYACRTSGSIELPSREQIQDMMTQFAGVERTQDGLLQLIGWLETFPFTEINPAELPTAKIEIVNMLTNAWLIATSALKRTESRGGHFRNDYPDCSPGWQNKRISRHIREREAVRASAGGRNL